jgi:predicted DNA-binding protein with PD1-like motif
MPAVDSAVGGIKKVVVFRLAPGNDLLKSITAQAEQNGIRHGLILGGAASLRHVVLRNVANYPPAFPITDKNRSYTHLDGPMELLAISGNISQLSDGKMQVHAHATVSVSTEGIPEGAAFGGHLVDGAIIFSTGEIAIAELTGISMDRVFSEETKTLELKPRSV